jgi:hypothetical protein
MAIFQISNNFYEGDGRVTDVSGQDSESLWGACDNRRLGCRPVIPGPATPAGNDSA